MDQAIKTGVARKILPLWDYGWLDHQKLDLPIFKHPDEFLDLYLQSSSSQTSFLGPEQDITPLTHGPFLRTKIGKDDFERIDSDEFVRAYTAIRQPDGFTHAVDEDQWTLVEELIAEVLGRNAWIFRFRLTEEDAGGPKAHEVGWIHTIFREFLFAAPETQNAERLVFGYD